MKKMHKPLSLLLCTLMILTQLAVVAVVDTAAAESVTGASQVVTESIYLNGEDTGVIHTQMLLPKGSKYALYSDGVLNVAEIAKDGGASFKVINHGTYNWGKATVGDAAVAYNKANENSTVLAAVNACPWLMATTDYDGDHQSSTGPSVKGGAGGSMSMGFMMIDGEIWNTNWFSDENKMDNKYYTDWAVSGQACFYVMADGSYDIGLAPNLNIQVINTTNNKKATVDGINRLPAPNSIVVYNKRAYSESLAYEDAYEVYLECADTSFAVDDSVTGTVTHIFKSGDTTKRPEITENTVVISGRGTTKGVDKLTSCNFKVGDKVSVSVTNKSGSAGGAVQIIGGFFTLVENGRITGQPTNQDQYPCSIVGIREDGSAILINITSQSDKKYQGSRQMDLPSLCKELGCVDALLFDGGGSSTFVTLEEGVYIRRNGCSDGQPRVLGNSLAIVYDYEGDDVNGSYERASLIGLLDGEQNDNRPVGYVAPPETFDETADILAYPKAEIPYASNVDWINGVGPDGTPLTPYTDLASYLNVAGDNKKAAKIDGKLLTTDSKYLLTISGWAQTKSGQSGYYWSLDGYSWYQCVSGSTAEATEEITTAAKTITGLETLSAENARFGKIAADLTSYEGETINLHFAVADADGKLINILTIEELTVSHKHVYDNDCDVDCNRCGETRTTDGHVYDYECDADCNICGETHEIGEHVNNDGDFKCDNCGADVAGEVISTVPTEPVTEAETQSTADGCASTVGVTALVLMALSAGFVCLKKKEN